MTLKLLSRTMLPAVEAELHNQVDRLGAGPLRPFREMLYYHMGWTGGAAARRKTGKRIRPLLTLLCCSAAGGQWRAALPAATAVEIIHNFSLVHDDIQDNSPLRRGRPTVWKKHGVPMAINAGDAFFAIANLASLERSRSTEATLRAAQVLQQACIDLTRGQYLDLANQTRPNLSLRNYWVMIGGKTAALVSAAAAIGATHAGGSTSVVDRYAQFGRFLGLAFQVQDDIIGIWGDEKQTGKSAASDLAEGKLSLPVLYGISRKGRFARAWRASHDRGREARKLRRLLQEEGGLDYSREQSERLTQQALDALHLLHPRGRAGKALEELTAQLLGREL
jgi:geranylgeranyl diphosphate synthase type I